MSWLSNSLLGWAGAAVLLFWFVGAHNRLVRLRSTASPSLIQRARMV